MFLIPPFALRAGARLYWFCQRWMPSNILVRRVRARDGLRWGIPLALLGLIYLAVGIVCAMLAQYGDGGGWYLGFLYGFWNAINSSAMGSTQRLCCCRLPAWVKLGAPRLARHAAIRTGRNASRAGQPGAAGPR
jgi:hypothetical protein